MSYQTEAPTLEEVEAALSCEAVAPLDDLSHDDWLELRHGGIGGSDASAVLGWSRYTSPLRLWMEKTRTYQSPDAAGEAAEWGHRLEEAVAVATGDKHDLVIYKPRFLYRGAVPFQLGNPDRFAWDPVTGTFGIIECKTAGIHVAEDWDDGPAMHALVQSMHYLAVTGLAWARISVLIAGQRFESHFVERDDELIEMITTAEAAFWDQVQNKIEPAPIGWASDTDLLKELWPEAEPLKRRLLPPDAMDMAARRRELKESITKDDFEKTAIDNQMRAWLEDREDGVGEDGVVLVTYKNAIDGTRRLHYPKPKTPKKKMRRSDAFR